jgi:hypothetical protein
MKVVRILSVRPTDGVWHSNGKVVDGTQNYGYPNYERLSQPRWAVGYFLMGFWIYFHAGKWPQINWYSGIYFCEGKRPKIKALTSCTTPTRQLPTSWQPSRVVLGPHFTCMCHVLEAFIAPATCVWRGDTSTGNHMQQQQQTCTTGHAAWVKSSPIHLLIMHNPSISFSLRACPIALM